MQIQPECRPCLERLVDLTVSLATTDLRSQGEARHRALDIIAADFHPGAISAHIANRFHPAIKAATGNPDPFRSRKDAETDLLRRLFAEVAPGWGKGWSDLVALAVAGNTLDFFRSAAAVAHDIRQQVKLTGDISAFQERCATGQGLLLYLADNAGEQFFDQPLVAALRQRDWQVLYVVKGGPIQNDLTLADLEASGLFPLMEPVVDTGALTVGLVLEETSSAFQDLWRRADLILAKGMGHYETLSYLTDPRLFFLLQAKCPPVAASLGRAPGSFVLQAANKASTPVFNKV